MRAAASLGIRDADIEPLKSMAAEGDNARFLQHSIAGLTMTHREWLKLDNERQHMRLKFNAFFREYDILLCPAVASAAPMKPAKPNPSPMAPAAATVLIVIH